MARDVRDTPSNSRYVKITTGLELTPCHRRAYFTILKRAASARGEGGGAEEWRERDGRDGVSKYEEFK